MRRAHAMPFGAELTEDGTRFSLWAPSAETLTLVCDGSEYPMEGEPGKPRQIILGGIGAGSRYGFRLPDGLVVPDPASRFQPDDAHGLSQVVDPRAYEWRTTGWRGRPWEEAVIYELHLGTVSPEGTYAGLMNRLEDLRDLGVTAIELMPLSDTVGRRNWGYDGVLHYAPDSAYGTPAELKALIDRAHELGLMVLLDVVYNHFGPTGNYLHAYAEAFFTDRHQTPWGAGINVDGQNARHVRDFFIENALYWLDEYQFDGLRLDAVHAIKDDSDNHILAELAMRVRAAFPDRHVHLCLENDANEARWLSRSVEGKPKLHSAQWSDDIHHCWHAVLTGETDGYYEDYADDPVAWLGRALAEGFAYQGDVSKHRQDQPRGERSGHLPPSAFVAFLQNHDQVGNRALGERISDLVPPERLALGHAALLLCPHIPMLFMGEEWSASSPFLFFVDFESEPELAQAVREGRRREFAHFKAFAAGDIEVPDPGAEETFLRSKLKWDERGEPEHAQVLARTRELLALRQREIVPLTRSKYLGAQRNETPRGVLDIIWRFEKGEIRMMANFSEEPVILPGVSTGHALFASPGATTGPQTASLPAWSLAMVAERSRA